MKPDRGTSLLQEAQPARVSEASDPMAFSRNGPLEMGGTTVPLVPSQQGPCYGGRRIKRLAPAVRRPFARPPRLGQGSLCASGHGSSGHGWLGINGTPPPLAGYRPSWPALAEVQDGPLPSSPSARGLQAPLAPGREGSFLPSLHLGWHGESQRASQ